jgi:hypothetical protein
VDLRLRVRFLQAVFVAFDEICFALYEAESAADVDASGLFGGLEFDRIGSAQAVL